MTDAAEPALAALDADREGARARWFEVLRIPSISAHPDHAADCRRAAEWLGAQLAGIGFAAEVRPTKGHPIVLAHHAGARGAGGREAPHLLYYGHYDVQPPIRSTSGPARPSSRCWSMARMASAPWRAARSMTRARR